MSTETTYTYEVVDLRPAADGWSVRKATISSDGDVTFETLPLAGWGVVERYVADDGHSPVTPTGVRSVRPVVWDPDFGCLVTLEELESLSHDMAFEVADPGGWGVDDAELAGRLRTRLAIRAARAETLGGAR